MKTKRWIDKFDIFLWNQLAYSLSFANWKKYDHIMTHSYYYLTGKFCEGLGNTIPTGKCAEGYFCLGNSNSSTPTSGLCPKGYFCPPGSEVPIECSPGKYCKDAGLGMDKGNTF